MLRRGYPGNPDHLFGVTGPDLNLGTPLPPIPVLVLPGRFAVAFLRAHSESLISGTNAFVSRLV